jgi:hypothetical protein
MTCTFNNPLNDETLFGFLYGDLPPDTTDGVQNHLDRCPYCAAAYHEQQKFVQKIIVAAAARHPKPQTLQEYHFRLLSIAQTETIAAHLKTCPSCHTQYNTLAKELDFSSALPTPATPPQQTQPLSAFTPHSSAHGANQANVIHLNATPHYDHVAVMGEHPNSYSAIDSSNTIMATLHLDLCDGDCYNLDGHVVGPNQGQSVWDKAIATLYAAPQKAIESVAVSAIGKFKYTCRPKGSYKLRIRNNSGTLLLWENIVLP